MWIGWIEFDLLLGDVHSLKEKRSIVRPLVAELARRFAVSAAEVGAQDLHRRSTIGVSLVSGDGWHIRDVLESIDRFVGERPELQVLASRRRLLDSDD
ncbi:DUF503 domain-containing protein [Naasia aerilata]|uniref:DUF503 domain-containing protein n=1 Tax=Naasia aerilata TaxID=1162966 RepID=A0ABN6XIV8_9MICO|nr:DUF503 domain-containing protein [Naasia aerilata]BDZ44765.1 hypothetical protein GCM10025866_06740 [Naasia aerilata]